MSRDLYDPHGNLVIKDPSNNADVLVDFYLDKFEEKYGFTNAYDIAIKRLLMVGYTLKGEVK